jgi:hypothetical protein
MKAWQILERDGWCQGNWTNPIGQRCLASALEAADVSLSLTQIREFVALTGTTLTAWNDAPGRTAEEVIGLLKRLDI